MSTMTPLAVFLSSLLGSVHCMAMCGGFATAVTAADTRRVRSHVLYHGGRLIGYVALGIVAALVGWGLRDLGLAITGVNDLSGLLMGLLLIGMGVASLLPRRGRSSDLVTLGGHRSFGLGSIRRRFVALLRHGGPWAPAGIGLFTALLPCGWLWGYVAVAAATADPLVVAPSTMAAFWLGTLPALGAVGLVARWARGKLGRWAPRLTALIFIGVGLASLTGKLGVSAPTTDTSDAAQTSPEPRPCH